MNQTSSQATKLRNLILTTLESIKPCLYNVSPRYSNKVTFSNKHLFARTFCLNVNELGRLHKDFILDYVRKMLRWKDGFNFE